MLDHIIPRVSPPLIQIGLGLLIVLFLPQVGSVTLDPEFFLMLFVAPLLFNDAKEADKLGLWRNKGPILALALGLVLVLMVVVGLLIHLLIPSIPLPAAFALGAALGPTDAVAVISLKKAIKINPRESSLLQGEALINDASGVVAFQFSIAAAVYGVFSIGEAVETFFVGFLGGIALGLVMAWIANWVQDKVRDLGFDSTTFHVLLDVMLPFMVFGVSEAMHVSGVLAVVAAGLLISSFGNKAIGPNSARMGIVTSSAWRVVMFALNGIVFVMLGMQLPDAMTSSIMDTSIDNWSLVGYVVLLTAVVVLVRLVWVCAMDRVAKRKLPPEQRKGLLRSALVTTVGGPKGAVTLSVIFSIPFFLGDGAPFPERMLLIFLASGVILLTLLLANFTLPLLAPAEKEVGGESVEEREKKEAEASIAVLNNVISELLREHEGDQSRAANQVVRAYQDRIQRIRTQSPIDSANMEMLRLHVLEVQRDALFKIRENKAATRVAVANQLFRIARSQSLLSHRNGYGWLVLLALRHLPTTIRALAFNMHALFARVTGKAASLEVVAVRMEVEQAAIAYLESLYASDSLDVPRQAVKELLMRYQASIATLSPERINVTAYAQRSVKVIEIERHAYELELDQINQMLEDGAITRAHAKRMRDNVYMMMVDLEDAL